ncbi:MAG: hypothetical protein HY459_04545 [Parcubacteria group bacterium]|nr:hypothetical protein [Parcubacteria group bacterium]
MSALEVWTTSVANTLIDLWQRFLMFLPNLIGALIVFFIGWFVAAVLGMIVMRVVAVLRIDEGLRRLGVHDFLRRGDFDIDAAKLLGGLVKWFLLIVFFSAATDILKLDQVTAFLNRVLGYLPSVIVAVLILMVGALVAQFFRDLVTKSAKAANLHSAAFLGGITKWAIVIFTVLAALNQLGVATGIISTLFTGLVAMIAIAGGLAFGLGGKETAQEILHSLKSDLGRHE